ncbi:MAG: hypothetical protein U9R48_03335 [Chloroflexota bacterium]|nr:hypothetical protein [Chloroflexota bacterium]
MVRANLSGHDFHGVLRIAEYAAQVDGGGVLLTMGNKVAGHKGYSLAMASALIELSERSSLVARLYCQSQQ